MPVLQFYRGSAIGATLPMEDQLYPARALYAQLTTANPHKSMDWQSEHDVAISGCIEVFPLYTVKDSECWPYHQTITTKHHIWKARGLACRNPSKMWVIVEEKQTHF